MLQEFYICNILYDIMFTICNDLQCNVKIKYCDENKCVHVFSVLASNLRVHKISIGR